jgi:cytochrome c oxidase cbb3-type subunit 4
VDYETLIGIQGYAKFFFLLFLTIVFVSYGYTLYKRQRSGEVDYEEYSKLVLDDEIGSQPLEKREKKLEKGER